MAIACRPRPSSIRSARSGAAAARANPPCSEACYRNALRLAAECEARSIAFPSISTGIYGYPIEAAARLAVATVQQELARYPGVDEVLFCCFSASDLAIYQQVLAEQPR